MILARELVLRLGASHAKTISDQNLFHHLAKNVCQSEITARIAKRQAFVVESEAVQDRRLEIVNVDWLLDDVVTQLVGRTMNDARFDAAAGEPHRVRTRVMIAAELATKGGVRFDHW